MNHLFQNASSRVAESPSSALIGIGVAVAIALGPAFWTGIHLRGKTHARLFSAVAIAKAGLPEEAIRALRIVQAELAVLLPESGGTADPENIFADPAKVERNVKKGIQVLKQRDQLPKQFEDIIYVCRVLGYISVITTIGIWISLLTYAAFFSYIMVWRSILIFSCAALAVGVVFLAKYVLLNSKIQNSIELANPVARD